MQIGDFRTRRKVTGRLFIALVATPDQFRDYGNVSLTKQETKIDRAQQMTASKGSVQVTHEEPGKVELRHTFKLDEHHTDLIGLMHLAAPPQADNQGALVTQAWPVGGLDGVKQGYDYYVGAMGLTLFTVTGKTLNDDYTIDLGSGMLHIVEGGAIADNSNIVGTLSCPALSFSKYTALSQMFVRGNARLITTDGNTDVPREVVTGGIEIYISDWGDNDGTKFNDVTAMVLWTDRPTVRSLELA